MKPDRIQIVGSGQNGIRRIWMDGRDHPKDEDVLIPQHHGHSIAPWEGMTLVVDTKQIDENNEVEPGFPMSDKMHIIERWTPIPGNRIQVDITMDNPDMFTRPWQMRRVWGQADPDPAKYDEDFLEWGCENNRSMYIDGRTVLIGPDGKPLN